MTLADMAQSSNTPYVLPGEHERHVGSQAEQGVEPLRLRHRHDVVRKTPKLDRRGRVTTDEKHAGCGVVHVRGGKSEASMICRKFNKKQTRLTEQHPLYFSIPPFPNPAALTTHVLNVRYS